MDDVAGHTGDVLQDHVDMFCTLISTCRSNGLHINVRKCHFFTNCVKYLGHIISKGKIFADPAAIDAVLNMHVPTDVPSLRRFLGLAGWLRNFVKGFSAVAAPLTYLFRKDVEWHWGADQSAA